MRLTRYLTLSVAVALSGVAASAQSVAPADSLSVAVGTTLGTYIRSSLDHLAALGVPVDYDVFITTMARAVRNESTGFTPEQADRWLDAYISATRPADLPDTFEAAAQQAFVDSVAAIPGALRLPSGLVYIVEKEGEGLQPTLTDNVQLKYVLRFSDGTVADATGSPVTFRVSDLTPGFTQGLQMMRPGGTYRIVMPAHLGYGEQGITGAVPGNAALDFTVELIDIVK